MRVCPCSTSFLDDYQVESSDQHVPEYHKLHAFKDFGKGAVHEFESQQQCGKQTHHDDVDLEAVELIQREKQRAHPIKQGPVILNRPAHTQKDHEACRYHQQHHANGEVVSMYIHQPKLIYLESPRQAGVAGMRAIVL